jgi:hypothetical protein
MSWSGFPGSLNRPRSQDEAHLPDGKASGRQDLMTWLVSLVARILTARLKLLTLPPPDYPLLCDLSPSTGFASVTRCKALVTEAVSIATVQAPRSVRSPPSTQGQTVGSRDLCTSGHTFVTWRSATDINVAFIRVYMGIFDDSFFGKKYLNKRTET